MLTPALLAWRTTVSLHLISIYIYMCVCVGWGNNVPLYLPAACYATESCLVLDTETSCYASGCSLGLDAETSCYPSGCPRSRDRILSSEACSVEFSRNVRRHNGQTLKAGTQMLDKCLDHCKEFT